MKRILICHAEFILRQAQDDVKRVIPLVSFLAVLLFIAGTSRVLASGEEVKRGEEIWQKLSANQLKCENLTDGEFENLGEFFMERMVGSPDSHEITDKQMAQMMGEDGLEQMHMVMGKRMSGCQTDAVVPGASDSMMGWGMMGPSTSSGWKMMMNMMGGGGKSMMGSGMMGWGGSPGWMMGQAGGTFWIWIILSWITWILVIVALVAFIRWMWKKGDKK